jgi:predicted GNAT superfamily acetyltransferase
MIILVGEAGVSAISGQAGLQASGAASFGAAYHRQCPSRSTLVGSHFTIRPFASIDEFRECVRFQEEIWGTGFSERVAVAILKVSQRLGGVAAGAYDPEGGLAGFVFGMTGVQEGEIVHWSDMLAVRPELHDAGLGMRLKAYQREELIASGVTRMHWTFDPLEAKNAYFNLNKLGAVAGEYVRDMYGLTDSPLHRGIGTDRFVATWEMDSPRVMERLVEGRAGPDPIAEQGAKPTFEVQQEGGLDLPGEPDIDIDADRLLVPVPESIQSVRDGSLEAAQRWRTATRSVLSVYLERGFEAREFYRRNGWGEYLLVSEGS